MVAPGADPSQIAFRIRGAKLEINHGDLILHGADADFVMHKPVIYQEFAGERHAIEGGFVRKGKSEVAFRVGPYDHAQSLVIDPSIGYASFLGGASSELGSGIAVDDTTPSAPKFYVSGFTIDSTTFPEASHIIGSGSTSNSFEVGFVAKIDPTVTGAASLDYLTFIGGKTPFQSADMGCHTGFVWLALDKTQGPSNVQPVLGGQTSCSDYPVTTVVSAVTGPSQDDIGSVATRLNASGTAVDQSAIIGGEHTTGGGFVAVGPTGNVLLSGSTHAKTLPTQNAYVSQFNNGGAGTGDCFVSILERSDLKATYLTYLNVGGGSNPTAGNEPGCGAFEDSSGNILAGGNTPSATSFNLGVGGANLANGFQPTFQGTMDTFIMKLNPSLAGVNQFLYGSYFGGGGETLGNDGAFDLGNGVVAIVGGTISCSAQLPACANPPDIPMAHAFQTTNLGAPNGNHQTGYLFLVDSTKTGISSLLCSTYFGGSSGFDAVRRVSYDAADPTAYRIVLGGETSSSDFPLQNSLESFTTGNVYGFVSVLKVPLGTQTFNASLYFSSYVGSGTVSMSGGKTIFNERVDGVAVDTNHTIYVLGAALSSSYFGTAPVNGFQTTCQSCAVTPTNPFPLWDSTAFTITTGPGAILQSITVTPGAATIAAGKTQQFNAQGFYNDGTILDVTTMATWSSANTAAATVSNAAGSQGLATGVSGSASPVAITAALTGIQGTASLTVTAGTTVTLQVATAGTALGTVTDNLGQINCQQIMPSHATGNCTANYPSGTQVTLTAATVGMFGGFVGSPTACNGTGNICQLTITASDTVTATFNPGTNTFPLTVQAGAMHTGGGTVTSSPAGINCVLAGTTTSGTCTANFGAGALVTLMQTPGAGSTFFGWTGTSPACIASSAVSCEVGMTAATTAEAEFTSGGGTVNVTVTGPGNVKDTANAGTINCTNTAGGTQTGMCTSGYALGTPVTLTETPTGTATFSGWTGASCANPTATTCTFQVTNTTPIAVGATFAAGGGAATHFSVMVPTMVTAGSTFNLTVTALTATNTTATGYTGTVHFTSSDGKAVLPANSALLNGVMMLPAVLNTAGGQTITATDTVTASITGTSGTVTVTGVGPGPMLTISKTHAGNFTQGQQGAQYSLTVANAGTGPTAGGQSGSVSVQSTGSIYDTGGGSTPPTMMTLPSGATTVVFSGVTGSITAGCASTEGCIILNHGTGDTPNDPDGVGAVPATSSNTGTSSISGMVAPGAGYLVGLFVPAGGPTGTAPTALDFTSTGLGTAFTALSPQLDQVFFIGDGLTGNGTGTQQTFNVPTGAGQLWLGISDAGGYNGVPGAYGDNLGVYGVNFAFNASGSGGVMVTETATAGLTLVSIAGTGWTCGTPNETNVCTRFDALAGGASYPVITATVNVAANATSPQVNMAGVTGGGSAPANASDSTVIVSASTATHFSVTAPATATPGTPITFTVTALDASNGTVTGYAGTVHFTSSDAEAALPANSTLTNGVGTFQATLNTVGNQTITATDIVTASITGVSGTIVVGTAGTVQLTVQTAGTGTGTVTGNGINCTSGSANACMASLPAGTQVVLTEAGTNGSTFAGWNGAPTSCTAAGANCSFTMPGSAETVTATFTAAAATLKSIAVTPANPTEPINSSAQFTATGTFSDNSTKDITATVTWASSNTEAATINAAGLVTVGGTAGLTTTISATLNEVTGSTLLTVSSSPIAISVTPPAGGTFPPVPPGGTLAIGIVLTSTPGFSGTVTFGCTTSSPTITCAPDPATVTLTPTGPTDVAIVLNTFCKGATTTGSVPIPGGFGGGITLLLLSLTLASVVWMWRRNPRWAVSFAILVLMAIGGASCASPPKGPNGATQPGNYTVTFTATVNGVTTSTAPIPFTVE
jgi:hypothetical protein